MPLAQRALAEHEATKSKVRDQDEPSAIGTHTADPHMLAGAGDSTSGSLVPAGGGGRCPCPGSAPPGIGTDEMLPVHMPGITQHDAGQQPELRVGFVRLVLMLKAPSLRFTRLRLPKLAECLLTAQARCRTPQEWVLLQQPLTDW